MCIIKSNMLKHWRITVVHSLILSCQNLCPHPYDSESLPTFLPTPVSSTITVPPMDTTVVSPNSAVFTCEADGVSTPVVTWWRREPSNSLTQLSSDGINVTILEDRNLDSRTRQSNFTILQPQPIDAAEYVCMATNELHSDTVSAVLTVYGKYL